jgi:hypothetical protein
MVDEHERGDHFNCQDLRWKKGFAIGWESLESHLNSKETLERKQAFHGKLMEATQ